MVLFMMKNCYIQNNFLVNQINNCIFVKIQLMKTIGRKQTLINKLEYIKMYFIRTQNYSQASCIRELTLMFRNIDINDNSKLEYLFSEIDRALLQKVFDKYTLEIMSDFKKYINNDIRKVKLLKIEKLYIF